MLAAQLVKLATKFIPLVAVCVLGALQVEAFGEPTWLTRWDPPPGWFEDLTNRKDIKIRKETIPQQVIFTADWATALSRRDIGGNVVMAHWSDRSNYSGDAADDMFFLGDQLSLHSAFITGRDSGKLSTSANPVLESPIYIFSYRPEKGTSFDALAQFLFARVFIANAETQKLTEYPSVEVLDLVAADPVNALQWDFRHFPSLKVLGLPFSVPSQSRFHLPAGLKTLIVYNRCLDDALLESLAEASSLESIVFFGCNLPEDQTNAKIESIIAKLSYSVASSVLDLKVINCSPAMIRVLMQADWKHLRSVRFDPEVTVNEFRYTIGDRSKGGKTVVRGFPALEKFSMVVRKGYYLGLLNHIEAHAYWDDIIDRPPDKVEKEIIVSPN